MDGQHMVFRWGTLLLKCIWKKNVLCGSDICWVKTFACGQNPFWAAIWSTGIVRPYFLWFWWRMYEWERNINLLKRIFFYQPFNLIQPTSRVFGNNKIELLHTQLQECLVRRHIFRTISFTQNWKTMGTTFARFKSVWFFPLVIFIMTILMR